MRHFLAMCCLLAACAGSAPAPTEAAPAAVTVLYAGRDGVLVQGASGVAQIPVDDPDLLTGLEPGVAAVPTRDDDGTLTGVEPEGKGALPEHFESGGYPLTGTVMKVDDQDLVVDHEAIEGLMPAMAMPYAVSDAVLAWAKPGDEIEAKVIPTKAGYWLVDVLRTGREKSARITVPALKPGEVLDPITLSTARAGAVVVGKGQDEPTVLTFLFTRCPDPRYCPALVARLQPLQEALGTSARIVAVTMDPEYDTMPVLKAYADGVGARAETWAFARPTTTELSTLAQEAGLTIHLETGRLVHDTRVMVLDASGRLVQRYDDNQFPIERVVEQLHTGKPAAGE